MRAGIQSLPRIGGVVGRGRGGQSSARPARQPLRSHVAAVAAASSFCWPEAQTESGESRESVFNPASRANLELCASCCCQDILVCWAGSTQQMQD